MTEAAKIAELMGMQGEKWHDTKFDGEDIDTTISSVPDLTLWEHLGVIEGWCRERGVYVVPCDWSDDDTKVLSWIIEPGSRCPLIPDGKGYMVWWTYLDALVAAVEVAR